MSKSGQMGTPRGDNTHDPGLSTTVKTTATRRRAIEAEHPEPSSKFSLLVTAMAVPETQVTPPTNRGKTVPVPQVVRPAILAAPKHQQLWRQRRHLWERHCRVESAAA